MIHVLRMTVGAQAFEAGIRQAVHKRGVGPRARPRSDYGPERPMGRKRRGNLEMFAGSGRKIRRIAAEWKNGGRTAPIFAYLLA
jgi:hypothetical protein